MADIFISYAREDTEAASRLASRLEDRGWSVFWDRRIPAGRNFHEVIASELAAARAVIVLWSEHGAASSWVYEEAAKGRDRGILAPVLIDKACQIPMGFGLVQCADLTDWDGDSAEPSFQQLMLDIEALVGGAGGATAPKAPMPPRTQRPAWRRAWPVGASIIAVAVIAGVTWMNVGERSGKSDRVDPRVQPQPSATDPSRPAPPLPKSAITATVPGKYPEASARRLSADELATLSAVELRLMRNEIYARHGYVFQSPDLRAYFSQQSWYQPVSSDVEARLTDIEKANVNLIRSLERQGS